MKLTQLDTSSNSLILAALFSQTMLKAPTFKNYVLIIHEVDDFSAWKKEFDQASTLRKAAGEIEFKLLKYENNPNKVVYFSKWQTHA